LNEFKSIELKIKNCSEKYQISQNDIFLGQEIYDNLGRLKDERDREYCWVREAVIGENEAELREGEEVLKEVDRYGEEILGRYGELLEEGEGVEERMGEVLKDVGCGMELTLHNVVCDY
jgi:hypothetical protein